MARLLLAIALAAPAFVAVTANPAAAAEAPQVRQIGEEKAANVAIAGKAAGHMIHEPGSSYIKVHMRLSPDAHVTVSNPSGTEVHTYHGTKQTGDSDVTLHGRKGFAALSIDGDTAVVKRHAGEVHIDGYWRGFREDEMIGIQSVCSTDARRDVVCYQTSHPTEYARSRAVAKLLIGGGGSCTTWRVGNTNRMLTNKHCFSTQAAVQSSEMQFNYQCATCGGNNPGAGTKVSGAQLIKVSTGGSGELDYTLYSVNNFAAIQGFGTLYLETRAPRAGERIYIPGHGDGRPKRLSIFEDTQNGAVCTVRNAAINSWNMSYSCDTSGGNSGSPVLSANHRVLALHHLGGCPNNQGARMHLIYQQIATLIDNNG
ncbi:trypsin-like serine peptidase [Allorhizocola rhizosphaerae]|uniref:trypsin-like serine peptidase n=1 Tax=Allorhizocola rhizosphaerae TaxID=1872709 RepID=UPI001FE6BE96|nr:serine protease [Allorhizocola rhizosphaerae]